jgi:GH24 family phage-related lysozyme (muramidase)
MPKSPVKTVQRKMRDGEYRAVDEQILRWRKERKKRGLRANGEPMGKESKSHAQLSLAERAKKTKFFE